jgi:hypothetical protein
MLFAHARCVVLLGAPPPSASEYEFEFQLMTSEFAELMDIPAKIWLPVDSEKLVFSQLPGPTVV